MNEPEPTSHNFKIQAHMEQRDATMRDCGAKVEVSESDLTVLTTLASLALSNIISRDQTLPRTVRERCAAIHRDHCAWMQANVAANGVSILHKLMNDGVALLTEPRLGKYALFPYKGETEGEPTS